MYIMGIWIPYFRKARVEGAMTMLKGVGEPFRLPCRPGSRRKVSANNQCKSSS
jgi:hypothetical protein